MKPFTISTCPQCGRRFVRTIHACYATDVIRSHWSGRALSAANHAIEVAERERRRVDLGLVPPANFAWAADLEARANLIIRRLRRRSTCPKQS